MKGLIFIPDISGFTNFVNTIDMELGVTITTELLNVIIDNNPLQMELSEIEGDAILFYKIGKPIPLPIVLSSFKNMYKAFDTTFLRWKQAYQFEANLSLKLIVHYGDIMVYDIKGFRKLYGETVIESHNLLKNGNRCTDYVLVTEDYLKALPGYDPALRTINPGYKSSRSQLSTGVKKIEYYFYFNHQNTSDMALIPRERLWPLPEQINITMSV